MKHDSASEYGYIPSCCAVDEPVRKSHLAAAKEHCQKYGFSASELVDAWMWDRAEKREKKS